MKKKSPLEETPSVAPVASGPERPNLDTRSRLDEPELLSQQQDTSNLDQTPANAEIAQEGSTSKSSETDSEKKQVEDAQDSTSDELDAKTDLDAEESNPVVDGMETAPNDSEMISLATMDEVESGSTVAAREPLVTSSHRFSVAAAIGERVGLAAISASGNSSESQLGQAGTGSPQGQVNITQSNFNQSSQAAQSVLKNLGAELEKFRQSGESQVQLEIHVSDSESVKVRLNLRAGELRSTFITDSAELREALQKAWPEFSQTSRDRGFRFGDPSFQNAFSQNDSPSQGRQRQTDRENTFELPSLSKTPARHPASTAPSNGRAALWA
ncbi:MAG: hypothetical protein KGR46_08070 [Verrucomicrobia bacterium]|nr:hypothetical protein [Verrucomicrobiota bacterium]